METPSDRRPATDDPMGNNPGDDAQSPLGDDVRSTDPAVRPDQPREGTEGGPGGDTPIGRD